MAVQKILQEIISIPENFQLELEGKKVTVKSDKGESSRNFENATEIPFRKENNSLMLVAKSANRKNNAILKTVASHIRNLIVGLEKGYEYKLAIVFSHFPMNIAVKENVIEINNFAGEKKPRKAKIIGKTKVEIKAKEITVTGIVNEEVGQTAANIERATQVSGKDRRVFQDGIYIMKKGVKGD